MKTVKASYTKPNIRICDIRNTLMQSASISSRTIENEDEIGSKRNFFNTMDDEDDSQNIW